MIHLDHVQFDDDKQLLIWDMGQFSSIMFDASKVSFDENIRLTKQFVEAQGMNIVVEGACDEIVDATGEEKSELTTAEHAKPSSVQGSQIAHLIDDGVCKVNIWTALERDSSPTLFSDMVKHACRVAGKQTVAPLIQDGFLGKICATDDAASIAYFTTAYRQGIIFEEMKKIVSSYLELWYQPVR